MLGLWRVYLEVPAKPVSSVRWVNFSLNNQTYPGPKKKMYRNRAKNIFIKVIYYTFIYKQTIIYRKQNKVKVDSCCYLKHLINN